MLLVKDLELVNGKKINLKLERGAGHILQGPNGSGKSVLFRTLAGLYPGKYSAFTFSGKNLQEWNPVEFRSRLLYVGSMTHFPGDMRSEEFLEVPFRLAVYKEHKRLFEFSDYLKKWNLKGMPLAQLSSGQKQLLMVLRALNLKSELLLLDEPTSHMDSERTREVEELLKAWLNPDRSYFMISHSDQQVQAMGKVIRFNDLISE
jgi:putative ABC transport system ATP-binding protein